MVSYRLSISYLTYFLHYTSQVEWAMMPMPTLQIQHPRPREAHDPLLTFFNQVESRFSSSPVCMWELDHKGNWEPENCCVWIVLAKTLESKEIQPVHPKGDRCWIFSGRTDAEAEAAILWPPDVKSRLTGKDPDPGKDWRQEEKGTTEDEMVGWHHQLDAHEFEQSPGVGDGQGGLACCSPRGPQQTQLSD